MGRRLATAVHVQHPISREWVVLEPGDEPDEDLAAEITNPHAWEDEASDLEDGPEPGPEPGAVASPEVAQSAPKRRRKPTETDE
ncbi:hypothetical protein MUU72_29665 [Streptomyces sp. RS10V-4]|uniref:hypothetical protein n=1 Tax=Streptomyces rhizoryzae TaxID=2932493 RepID=UPI002005C5FD|nr:hypothetical protein [Streptomyces rhizoryzae]MCK7627214.1 hypothetical protein [Streptomyces rhizoryzae]